MEGKVYPIAEKYTYRKGTDTLNQAMSNDDFPRGGFYIDVRGTISVEVIIRLGVVVDTLVFELKSIDGASGTTQSILTGAIITVQPTADQQHITFSLETSSLADGQTHLTVQQTDGSAGSFANIDYKLEKYAPKQAVQDELILPLANQVVIGGGQVIHPDPIV